jgi:hypothetical protein
MRAKAIMTISIDPKIRTLIERVAISENRSLSSVISTLLERHFSIPRSRPESWTKRDEMAAQMDFTQEEADIKT